MHVKLLISNAYYAIRRDAGLYVQGEKYKEHENRAKGMKGKKRAAANGGAVPGGQSSTISLIKPLT